MFMLDDEDEDEDEDTPFSISDEEDTDGKPSQRGFRVQGKTTDSSTKPMHVFCV